MALNRRNLIYLALKQKLIGATIHTDKGVFRVIEFEDYHSQSHEFELEVQDMDTLETTIRTFSDKYQYGIDEEKTKRRPNHKRAKPIKNK